MRKLIIVALAAAAAFLFPVAVTASASASVAAHHVPLTFTGHNIVAYGTNFCWHNDGSNGDTVTSWMCHSGDNQEISNVTATSTCGSGVVTSNCPFPSGSHLNEKFLGDPIELVSSDFTFLNFASCGVFICQQAGGGGIDWVQAGNFSGAGNGAILVNVAQSTSLSDIAYASMQNANPPTGLPLVLTNSCTNAGLCHWKEGG